MAVTFLNTTTFNADGLSQRYGVNEGIASQVGEYNALGALREIEVNIPDMTALSATEANPKILSNTVFLPKEAFIRRVRVIVMTATTTGSTSLLNFGTVKRDAVTEGDFNGILDSINIPTNGAAAEGVEVDLINGSTGVGVLVGHSCGSDAGGYYFCASSETAVWTAGALKLQVFYDFEGR